MWQSPNAVIRSESARLHSWHSWNKQQQRLHSLPAGTDLCPEAPCGDGSESAHEKEDEERGVEEVVEGLADGTCQQREAWMQRRALQGPCCQSMPYILMQLRQHT